MNKLIIFALILVIGAGSGFTAYNIGQGRGFTQGKIEGFNEGYVEGKTQGITTGYDTGYEEGYNTGHEKGYSSGYTLGKYTGYSEGKAEMMSYASQRYVEGYNTGFEEGNLTGYSIGVDHGFSLTGYNIRDPTFTEMKMFIHEDNTNSLEYTEEFECEDFAGRLKKDAFDKGYRCYFVLIEFASSWHAINGFNTTDYGFVFIEPQSNRIMTVDIGKPYWDRDVYRNPSYDDTVLDILMIP